MLSLFVFETLQVQYSRFTAVNRQQLVRHAIAEFGEQVVRHSERRLIQLRVEKRRIRTNCVITSNFNDRATESRVLVFDKSTLNSRHATWLLHSDSAQRWQSSDCDSIHQRRERHNTSFCWRHTIDVCVGPKINYWKTSGICASWRYNNREWLAH